MIRECNKIQEELQFAAGREGRRNIFKLEQRHDISTKDLTKQLLNYSPRIVHFSGHGSPESALIFKNEERGEIEVVSPNALSSVFKVFSNEISLVFLNACYSEEQAKALSKHVDIVIGMSRAISDQAAITFATQFYSVLGFGRSVSDAFNLAKAQVMFSDLPEEDTPQLLAKEGVNPAKYFVGDTTTNPPPNPTSICEQTCLNQ